jgi:hypothetical protein
MNNKRQIALAKTINSFKQSPMVSDAYARMVPDLAIDQKGNVENFTTLSNIMLNTGYVKLQNEFIGALLNKIGLTLIQATTSANPLSVFKKGSLVKGVDVELIFSNPAVAEDIGPVNDANMQKAFKTYKPDTKVAYIRINRGADGLGEVYPITIAQKDIVRAFQSLETMDTFIVSLIRTLTAGDEIDEFKYTKKIVDNAVSQNLVRISPVTVDVASEASLRTFVATVRSKFLNFTLPSTLNNAYIHFPDSMGNPATVLSESSNIVLIIRSDILANIDVAVLARAFNMDKSDFLGRVVMVDRFENEGIQAILCDEAWLQIYDAEKSIGEQPNARTATVNYFLRCRGTFGISPFANAIVFVDPGEADENLPDIAATAIVTDADTVIVGETHNFRLTPTNSTETVVIAAASTATGEVDNDNKTFKATSTGDLILELESNGAIEKTVTAE